MKKLLLALVISLSFTSAIAKQGLPIDLEITNIKLLQSAPEKSSILAPSSNGGNHQCISECLIIFNQTWDEYALAICLADCGV